MVFLNSTPSCRGCVKGMLFLGLTYDDLTSHFRTGVFQRSEGDDVTTSRRQDSGKNLPGAPGFDSILEQLRQG